MHDRGAKFSFFYIFFIPKIIDNHLVHAPWIVTWFARNRLAELLHERIYDDYISASKRARMAMHSMHAKRSINKNNNTCSEYSANVNNTYLV